MGIHVDVSHLSQDECSQIVGVIAKDIALRKFDQERIRKLRKEFDELRRSITLKSSRRRSLDDNCQICGRLLFKFLCCFFSRGQRCLACEHLACSKCRHILVNTHEDTNYLCFLCVKKRELKRKSFDWFAEAVELRFKRFGSAKVLRGICRSHKADARVISLLGLSRELTLRGTIRRTSSVKAPSGYSSVRASSPTTSSLSESEGLLKNENAKAMRSKSTDDLGPLKSENTKSQRQQRSRKHSAPASLRMKVISAKEVIVEKLEPAVEVLETRVEEKQAKKSSDHSEFEVISSDQEQASSEEGHKSETSFSVRIFGEGLNEDDEERKWQKAENAKSTGQRRGWKKQRTHKVRKKMMRRSESYSKI